jgi:PAS domain S-box-containing protein
MTQEERARAENIVRLERRDVVSLATNDLQRLVHELQVRQVELEMENERLLSAEQERERSQEQYRELFDAAPAGYIVLDEAGTVVRANAVVRRMVSGSCTRLIGQRFADLIEHRDLSLFQAHLDDARSQTHSACEVQLRVKDGANRLVRLDIAPVPSRGSDYLIVLTETSERQFNLEAIQELNAELDARVAARTADLEQSTRKLESQIAARELAVLQRQTLDAQSREVQRLESLGLLAGGIAHDINNLLVGVLGNADLLLMEPGLPDDWRDALSVMRDAGRKASDVTRQLNIFAGRGQSNTAPVSLPHVVASSLQQLRSLLSPQIQLLAQITSDVPAIEADRAQLHQLITNLLTNAIESIRGEGVIAIDTRATWLSKVCLNDFQHSVGAEPGNYAVLRVQDSGVGIPPEHQGRIFEPFFTTKFTGRGLGLATVLGIVQSHHGAVRMRTSARGGTCFEVAFPIAQAQAVSERVAEKNRMAHWTGSGSVLLIDDDDGVRGTISLLLERMGFDVTGANGGQAGIDRYRDGDMRFDFVVLDWSMPGVSGEQVLAAIREVDPELPIVLISGYCAENLALDDEHTIRVQKPMTMQQLEEAIRTVTADSVSKPWVQRSLRSVSH